MSRTHRALFLSAFLIGAPLSVQSELAAQTTRATSTPSPHVAGEGPAAAQPFQRVQPNVPPTPMPLSLPDPVRPSEIRNEYAFGIATLIAGALIVTLTIYAAVYVAVRRSWSATH